MLGAAAALGCERTAPGLPWPASMWRASRQELDDDLELVAGSLPGDLMGHVFVVGPVGRPGSAAFCGDGMVYRFSLGGGRAHLRSRLVRTDDFQVDEAAQEDPELRFVDRGLLRSSPAFGMRNLANTAPVALPDGRLLCTYDGGRPWEIDPATLAPLTAVGLLDTYRPMLPPLVPGLSFFPPQLVTAHPALDGAEGQLYLCNYGPRIEGSDIRGFARILRWDGRSEPVATELEDETGRPLVFQQTCHQIQVSRGHLVLQDGAFALEAEQLGGGSTTRAQMPVSVFYLVRKADLQAGGRARARRVEIPVESVHFLLDYEETDGGLTLLVPHTGSVDPSEWLRAEDEDLEGRPLPPESLGLPVGPADLSFVARHVIDTQTGQVRHSRALHSERLFGLALFTADERRGPRLGQRYFATLGFEPRALPRRIAEVYREQPHRQLPLSALPRHTLPGRLVRIDETAASGPVLADEYVLPMGHLPMSPTFVPRRGGGTDEGYLVALVAGPDVYEVWVLDAGALHRGPLCRLRHPRLQPGFTLHSTWMEEAAPRSATPYHVLPRLDYQDRIGALSPSAQALARRVLGI